MVQCVQFHMCSHVFNASTRSRGKWISVSLRLAWPEQWVQGQSEILSEIWFPINKHTNKQNEKVLRRYSVDWHMAQGSRPLLPSLTAYVWPSEPTLWEERIDSLRFSLISTHVLCPLLPHKTNKGFQKRQLEMLFEESFLKETYKNTKLNL